jgi:hypothetical protein
MWPRPSKRSPLRSSLWAFRPIIRVLVSEIPSLELGEAFLEVRPRVEDCDRLIQDPWNIVRDRHSVDFRPTHGSCKEKFKVPSRQGDMGDGMASDGGDQTRKDLNANLGHRTIKADIHFRICLQVMDDTGNKRTKASRAESVDLISDTFRPGGVERGDIRDASRLLWVFGRRGVDSRWVRDGSRPVPIRSVAL